MRHKSSGLDPIASLDAAALHNQLTWIRSLLNA